MSDLHIVKVKPHKRAGSYDHFVELYKPIDPPSGETMWEWNELPTTADIRQLWTILDCDGKLYVSPGVHIVNRLGYCVTKHGWSDTEFANPGYVW